ncbi:hypothetical protein PG987_010786 [Apiospora arundinis]|uniref:Uncharacterized protein n=1 Tax=Apiospora arundinis TaxID=335852 RepID=A0ABR2ISJ5_9PEZI
MIAPTVLRYACNDNAITHPGAAGQGDTRPIFFVAGRNAIIESDAEGRSCRRKARWGWGWEAAVRRPVQALPIPRQDHAPRGLAHAPHHLPLPALVCPGAEAGKIITALPGAGGLAAGCLLSFPVVVARLGVTYYYINFGATGASASISAVIARLVVTYYYIQFGATGGGSPVDASTQDIDPYDVKVGEILVLVSTGPPRSMPDLLLLRASGAWRHGCDLGPLRHLSGSRSLV